MLLRSLCIDSQRRADGTKRVTVSWRELAERLDVHEETIASWLKHQPIPGDKPWRQIIPIDEKAKNLGLFIPRLRYAYETHNGKTRRTGFLLEVLMEDHVVPEDEARLEKQVELMRMHQGKLGLETYRNVEEVNPSSSDLPTTKHNQETSGSLYVNQQDPDLQSMANPNQMGLHNHSVNPRFSDLPNHVKQDNTETESYVNQSNTELLDHKSENPGTNVNELDILIQKIKKKPIKKNLRRELFEPIITLTEKLLEDTHSTAMLYKVLYALYPERLDLYMAAVRVSLDAAEKSPQVNRGAVFVRSLREFADIAGIDLGLGHSSRDDANHHDESGNPGSQDAYASSPTLAAPSINEAIWAETQLALRRQMTQATYDAIIQGTILIHGADQKYVIGVQTEMAKQWLENRFHKIVQRALSSVVGDSVEIEFVLVNTVG